MFKGTLLKVVVLLLCASCCSGVRAEEGEPAPPPAPASPPPLPCITVEGTGGIFITPMAYLVNPSLGDQWVGKPSAVFNYASIGDKDFTSVGVTMTLFKRVELGFAHERLGLGSWPRDVLNATGLTVRSQTIRMNTFNIRGLILEEKDWLPTITAGLHYKRNEDIWDVNRDLAGTCKMLGVKDNDGWEATLSLSKTFSGILPRPFMLTAGVRNTDAVQTGLLGFCGHRDTVVEANAVFFLTDQLLLAGEYRQKPDSLRRFPGLVGREDDWWTICGAYVVNDHATIAVGYGNFGNILNNREDRVWAVHIKFEF